MLRMKIEQEVIWVPMLMGGHISPGLDTSKCLLGRREMLYYSAHYFFELFCLLQLNIILNNTQVRKEPQELYTQLFCH